MDIEHCVIAELSSEVAKFRIAADKRRYNVLSICPVAHPSPLRASECLTVQNYNFFPTWKEKKNPASQKASRNRDEEIVIFFLLTNL